MSSISSIKPARWILAFSSGVLLFLAFPKFDQGWLAWVALVPLLAALRNTDIKGGFALGFAAGLAQYLGLIYWTAFTMYVYGKLPLAVAVSILLLFASILALFTALYTALVVLLCRKPWQLLVLSPALWLLLEWLRGWIFTGFPWEMLGYSQYSYLRVIQIADLFGVPGISALLVFCNTVLALAALYGLDLSWQGAPPGRKGLSVAGAVLAGALAFTAGYGGYRLHAVDRLSADAAQVKVAVVQGNIDQAVKWNADFQLLTTAKYRALSQQAAEREAQLIVWPETAVPFFLFHDRVLTDKVLEGVRSAGADFIIGSPAARASGGRIDYYNRAYLITSRGQAAGRYDKVHLVPFGEYVPFKRYLPFLGKLVAQVGDFQAGRRGDTLNWQGRPIGMLICYEVIFPELARSMVQNGAQLLVNITNDAWFGRTSAAYQHFSMAVLRSVENRRFLARAANTGISGFIDPAGRVMATSQLFTDSALNARVGLLKELTLYTRLGDWPLVSLSFALLAAVLAMRRRDGRQVRRSPARP